MTLNDLLELCEKAEPLSHNWNQAAWEAYQRSLPPSLVKALINVAMRAQVASVRYLPTSECVAKQHAGPMNDLAESLSTLTQILEGKEQP